MFFLGGLFWFFYDFFMVFLWFFQTACEENFFGHYMLLENYKFVINKIYFRVMDNLITTIDRLYSDMSVITSRACIPNPVLLVIYT